MKTFKDDMKQIKPEEIRMLTYDDEQEILKLIKKSIVNKDELHIGGQLTKEDKNVNSFFNLEILPLLMSREPVFGCFLEGDLAGLSCCHTKLNNFYSFKESVAIGGITVTDPSYRRKGVCTKLRMKIGQHLKKKGIKKFIFEINQDNEASLSNAKKIADKLRSDAKLLSFKFEAKTDVF
jgi:phosphinothricin acetyltransferase